MASKHTVFFLRQRFGSGLLHLYIVFIPLQLFLMGKLL
jgi:hypothetical protein